MKKIVSLAVVFICLNISAQKCFKGKIGELKQLTKRELAIVIVPEKGNGDIERLTKKISKTKKEKKKLKLEKELNDLIKNIKHFNITVKKVVKEYWKLNNVEDITLVTIDDLKRFREEKSDKYAVLNFSPDEVYTSGANNNFYTFDYNLMTYGPSEEKRTKAKYRNHLVNTNFNFPKTNFKNKKQKSLIEELEKEKESKIKVLSEENIIVTLLIAQQLIEHVLESGDKITFSKYAKLQSDKNRAKLKGNKMLIQSAITGSKVYKNLDDYKDRIELVSAQRIHDAIINKEDVYIGFPVIKQYVKSKSSFGPIGFNAVITMDHKLVFNPLRGEITVFKKASMPLNYRSFKAKEINKIFK